MYQVNALNAPLPSQDNLLEFLVDKPFMNHQKYEICLHNKVKNSLRCTVKMGILSKTEINVVFSVGYVFNTGIINNPYLSTYYSKKNILVIGPYGLIGGAKKGIRGDQWHVFDLLTSLKHSTVSEKKAEINEILKLLDEDKSNANVVDERGATLLHCACGDDCPLEVFIALVKKSADVNAKFQSFTPLMYVCSERGCKNDQRLSVEKIKVLVNNDAELETIDEFGQTALIIAMKENKVSLVTALFEVGASLRHILIKDFFDDYSPEVQKALTQYGFSKDEFFC
jgi:hypothetical protein